MPRHGATPVRALLLAVLLWAGMASSAWASAPPSTLSFVHDGTACQSQPGTQNLSTSPKMSQTGIAFDGSRLLISCWGDTTITAISPTTGDELQVVTVSGSLPGGAPVKGLGALAYDRSTGTLWACASANNAGSGSPENTMNEVGTIDLAAGRYTPVFASHGCDNGLAYDPGTAPGRAGTLWTSADIATTLYDWTPSGTERESEVVGTTALLGATPRNSGIAIGGGSFYLANPQTTTKRVYRIDPGFTTSTQVLSSSHRYEDMECDDRTYSQTVIWVMWFNQNILAPLPISGACSGGAPPPPPSLAVSQTDSGPVTVGGPLGYTVTVTNSGSSDQTGVTVTDTPPANQSFDSATPSQGSCTASPPITCTLGGLAAGGHATITIAVTTTTTGTATNAASATSDQVTSPVTSSHDATVNPAAGGLLVRLSDGGFSPTSPGPGQGQQVQFTNTGSVAHSVADATGIGLFDSGPIAPGASFQYTWDAAGSFKVKDATTGHTATVKVPILVPATGQLGTPFTITWAAQAPPTGFVEDIQVEYPGTTTWVSWLKAQTGTSAGFTPSKGAGTYRFRARYRDAGSGTASAYSAIRSASVS